MKPTIVPAHTDTNRSVRIPLVNLSLRVGAILVLAGLLASVLYWSSAASASKNIHLNQKPAVARDQIMTPAVADLVGSAALRVGSFSSLLPLPPPGVSVTTYASDCTTPKTVFNLQDADKTVCAIVTGGQPSWRIIWSNANGAAVQNVPVGSGTSTFTLTAASSLGDWRVILFEPFGGSVQAVASFTVIDAANPTADVSVSKGAISGSISAGSQVVFAVQVANSGPSAASSVELTDSVPTNTSFVSFDQLEGPTFSCNSPTEGATSGNTVCTIASLNRGESATFVATYQVGGVSSGTVISNTASVTSATADPNSENNSSTSELTATGAACQLSTPENITVDADSGQSGATVTYATPTGTGDCGQTTTGEGGEIIPPISCSPASGSFFGVGTSTVICSAQTGAAVSFQVTVNNPGGGLSISLNGANPVAVECGTDFNDPGASAVNGSGQSVPVVVTYPGGFIPDGPAVGSYEATYTATEGANSVSTTRTINVADSEAPSITVDGANPYRIQQGSCAPFTDPGASANDGCAGAKPVSSSIAGPGGATSVNPNVPGTYTVTYTATDGTHQATATRTVLVGMFPEDEVDQPASSNVPPTITLTCPVGVSDCSQTSIECGDTFTDLGATASVCGGSVPVTTSGTVDRHTPGIYSITYTATANGLTATATRTVTVESDNTAPTITITGANPMTVECHTSFTDPGAVAHDACAGDFAATASGSVDANTVGQYTITYNATDPSGHAATPVTRTVNVVDTTVPTVSAPPNVTVNTGAGATSCGATVSNASLGTASATDSCQGALSTTRSGVPSGNIFPVGTTTITYSATDAHNNTGTATQTVIVVDNTPPIVTAPAAVTLFTGPGAASCGVTVSNLNATLGTGSASDNCSGVGAVTRSGVPAGNVFPKGSTTVTYTATDAHGNTSSATQVVTVVDNTPPAISCQTDIIADFNPAVNGAVVTYTTPVGTDNCAGATTTRIAGLASGSTFPLGTTTNTFRVTDAAGLTATCSFKVTVAMTSIIGLDSVTMTGAGYADSYSSAGGYPATKGSLANILSNGTITMGNSAKVWGNVRSTRAGINMTGASQVTGNATAGTTVTTSGSASVGGTRTNNALAPVMTLPSVPACGPPYSSTSGITGTYSYNASTGNLTLSGVNIATLANGTYCFNNVTLGNSAQLKVNGPVVIKLRGTLNTSGATSLNNTTQIPSNLRILSSYSGSNGVVLGNSASVYALIYAPNTGLNISGAAPLFGTVAAKTLTIGNSGAIHYDTQLKTIWPDVWALIF